MSHSHKARQIFIDEARDELLPELENALLELGETPDDPDLINRAFRALHTLKGSGAMFGFDHLAELAHEVETVFDHIRDGRYPVDNALIELTLTAKDQFQLLIENPESVKGETIEGLAGDFKEIGVSKASDSADAPGRSKEETETDASIWNVYLIRFKPHAEIFKNGTNPLFLLDELNGLGVTRIIAHTGNIPDLTSLDPEACYVWWDILLATDKTTNAIQDVFIFVEDDSELFIETMAENIQPGQEEGAFDTMAALLLKDENTPTKKLGQVFSAATPLEVMPENSQPAEADNGHPSQSKNRDSGMNRRSGSNRKSGKERRATAKTISSMRVQSAKLDQLVNLVGELVIAQTRLTRLADEKESPELIEIAEVIERLSNDLRENTLDIRMLPIGASFGKFKRVVWDLSAQRGKTVELVTEGAATELDKTVIERLDDPLVHLLRNSIDHGIETPEERAAAGKPPQGKIVFSAEHSGGHVIITIYDDGRGIDPEIVKAKAIEKGLLSPDAAPDEKDLLNLIFEPGFSTTDEVSDISGRGVGMDVVKQSITTLRGKVSIKSEKGRGTSIKMTIPLTLAIIDGLEVKISGQHYIVPLAVVSECLEMDNSSDQSQENRFINLRDQLVPFLRLREWFSVEGRRADKEQLVIVSSEKHLVGLVVDEVIGLQQTVIKNLGEAYKDIQGVSGATIQGDGSIALILDVDPLIQKAENDFHKARKDRHMGVSKN